MRWRRARGGGAALLLGLVAGGAGCKRARPPCSADLPALVEVRDGTGAPELSLRPPPEAAAAPAGALDVCDGAGRRVASLREEPSRSLDGGARGGGDGGTGPRVVELVNAAGDPMARLATTPGGDPSFTLTTPQGVRELRLHDEAELLRILDPIGVPVAQIGRQDGRTMAFDPAGTPLASAEIVDARRVVRARDGSVKHFVSGLESERAVAALALVKLPLPERVALARFLDQR